MDAQLLALIILLIIYIPTYFIVKKSKWCKEHGLVTSSILIMLNTRWGIKLMTRLGKYKRFWRVCGVVSWIVTAILMIGMVSILILDMMIIPKMGGTAGLGVTYVLAIPGINPALPLFYGWVGLIIAMVVHETAHGIQTKANDMEVESTGVIHCVVPLGAFVKPDEEQVSKCSRRAKMDLYAAGITTNFFVALLAFGLMLGGMTCGLTSDYGDSPAVYGTVSSSPGYDSGIPSTAIILSVDGNEVNSLGDFMNSITECKEYTVKYNYKGEIAEKSVVLGTYVYKVVAGSPADHGNMTGGTMLYSIAKIDSETGAVTEEKIIGSNYSFTEFMNTTKPGEIVLVKWYEYSDSTLGELVEGTVTLGDKNGIGYLGITVNTSGFGFTTPNSMVSTGTDPFYGKTTITEKYSGLLSFVGNAFSGYSPVPESTHWWYHSEGVPDNLFWFGISILFWVFWLNIVLGITNALPAVPFDGGFLFMGGLSFLFEKMGMKNEEKREALVDRIGMAVTYVVLAMVALIIVVMVI